MKGDVRFKPGVLLIGKARDFVRIDKLRIFFALFVPSMQKIWERNSVVVAEVQSGILCATLS